MPQRTRWVVLDAEDAGTLQVGQEDRFRWTGSYSDEGTFLRTLRTATAESSFKAPYPSMSLAFNGTEFNLYGQFAASEDGQVPKWGCTMDGAATKMDRSEGNSGPFSCSWKGAASSLHTFQLAITDSTPGSVSIDYVSYLPTYDSIRPKNAYIIFNHDDPDIKRSANWTTVTDKGRNAMLTSAAQSSLNLTWKGSRLIAEGWSPTGFPAADSDATYTINNGYPTSFKIKPPDPPSETIHGKTLFETTTFQSPGEDKNLTIIYKGPSAPLVIERFLIKDGNFRIGDNPGAPETIGETQNGDSSKILKIAVPSVVGLFILVVAVSYFMGWFSVFSRCCTRKKREVTPPTGGDKDVELTEQPSYTSSQQIPAHFTSHNESGVNLIHGDQYYQPYPHPPPPPPPPYHHSNTSQALSNLTVGGGGAANVAGRDATNITIHNLTVHPDAFNPRIA